MSIASLLFGTKATATQHSDGSCTYTVTTWQPAATGERLVVALTNAAEQQALLVAAERKLLLEKK